MHHQPFEFMTQHLAALKESNLYRSLRTIESAQDSWVEIKGQRVLNLCSNNYLGLASHPAVKASAQAAISEWGCGSGASRHICGNQTYHRELEEQLARFKDTEATILFNSGYQANLGIISALVDKEDAVFSDELNHASIIDGCRLSGANVVVFPHNDLDFLETSLKTHPARRKLIIVDSIFSMDGDLAPLLQLADLADRYEAILMIDEAHATGAIGPGGHGATAHFGITERVPVIMCTLGKALGSFGGFAAGDRLLIDYLLNTSRSFIFTTALPASVIAASLASLQILENDPSLPIKLQQNAGYLRRGLQQMGYDTLNSETQIMPIVVGEAQAALDMSAHLLAEGVLATPIRPPTVPAGSSRTRVTVMATHTQQDLDFALRAFKNAGQRLGII